MHCITQDFYVIAILLHGTHMHTDAILLSVYCLSHIQQEVENALEGLCNLLPSSISSQVGATKLVADMIVSSEHYCCTMVHSSFPFPSSLPPLSLHFSLPSPNIHTHIHTVRLTCSAILPTGLGSCPEWICKYIKHLTLRLYIGHFSCGLNPLTTDDAKWHRLTLAACYQLAQSVLKIGFVLAKKAG